MWRQGDILIEAVDAIPPTAGALNHRIIAEGAATGHRHAVEGPRGVQLYVYGGNHYLRVEGARATIVHPEHGPIVLGAGLYRIWRQREYTGTGTVSRNVMD
ncbi:MAG TPA: hypothetical protein VIX73_37240 [Kofleriaceae bacterium]|jgi:hypothetical protein